LKKKENNGVVCVKEDFEKVLLRPAIISPLLRNEKKGGVSNALGEGKGGQNKRVPRGGRVGRELAGTLEESNGRKRDNHS